MAGKAAVKDTWATALLFSLSFDDRLMAVAQGLLVPAVQASWNKIKTMPENLLHTPCQHIKWRCDTCWQVNCQPKSPMLYSAPHSLLIMLTSLAPSPMASVTALLWRFTRSTTSAFCRGVTRQQITALQRLATSRKSSSRSSSKACACEY